MKKNTPESTKKHGCLSLAEREEIATGLENGMKQCEIARRPARSTSASLKRNKKKYSFYQGGALQGEQGADESRRTKNRKPPEGKNPQQADKAFHIRQSDARLFA